MALRTPPAAERTRSTARARRDPPLAFAPAGVERTSRAITAAPSTMAPATAVADQMKAAGASAATAPVPTSSPTITMPTKYGACTRTSRATARSASSAPLMPVRRSTTEVSAAAPACPPGTKVAAPFWVRAASA